MRPDALRDPAPLPDDALRALRAAPAVRDAWRAALLDAVAGEPRPVRRPRAPRRALVLRPAHAAAASVALLVLGAGTALVATRAVPRPPPRTVAGATAAAPTAVALPAAAGPPLVPVRDAGDGDANVVRFMIVAPRAARVSVVGDFNRWDPDRTRLRPLADGRTWLAEVPLAPGRHAYAFVIDGAVTGDPTAPRAGDDDFGQPNSVVVVPPPRG